MSLIVLLVAAWVLGSTAMRLMRLPVNLTVESVVYRLMVGLVLCAVVIIALGSMSLSIAQLVVFLIVLAGLGVEVFFYSSSGRRGGDEGTPEEAQPEEAGPFKYVCALAILVALGLGFVGALAPVTHWDSCVAHLAVPRDYVREGHIYGSAGNEYSAYPHLMHSLFAYTCFNGYPLYAGFLNWCMGVLACGTAFVLGSRVEGRRCGWIAAAILATTPIFMDQIQAPSIDLAFTAVTLGALAALVAWRDTKRPEWLVLAAILAGSTCGIRHTGYLVCVLLCAGVLATARERRVVSTVVFGLVTLAAALPWLARSALVTGNPFFPFFMSWFPSKMFPHRDITGLGLHESVQGLRLLDFLRFPWDVVMRPQLFDGWAKSPGGLVLFLGIPGLVVGAWRARALGVFCIVGVMCFSFFQRFARYLLPFFAPMMVVAALAACRLKTLRHGVALVLVAAFGYGLVLDVAAVHFKFPVVFGKISRVGYLEERVERYPAFEWVNDNIPREDTILTFDRRTFYLDCRTYQNDEIVKTVCRWPLARQLEWFKANDIRWVFLPVTYIEESPGYHRDIGPLIRLWRISRPYFTPVKVLELPRPHGPGKERVEIYEVRYK